MTKQTKIQQVLSCVTSSEDGYSIDKITAIIGMDRKLVTGYLNRLYGRGELAKKYVKSEGYGTRGFKAVYFKMPDIITTIDPNYMYGWGQPVKRISTATG